MSRLTRNGTAEPVSRDQILRHARGQVNINFPVQLTTSRIGNLTRLIHTLLYVMTIHTIYKRFMGTNVDTDQQRPIGRVRTIFGQRRRREARSSTRQGSAEPLCARIKGANREVSGGKADL